MHSTMHIHIHMPNTHALRYKKPIALTASRGGPLLPVHTRHFDTDVLTNHAKVEWQLYESNWGYLLTYLLNYLPTYLLTHLLTCLLAYLLTN